MAKTDLVVGDIVFLDHFDSLCKRRRSISWFSALQQLTRRVTEEVFLCIATTLEPTTSRKMSVSLRQLCGISVLRTPADTESRHKFGILKTRIFSVVQADTWKGSMFTGGSRSYDTDSLMILYRRMFSLYVVVIC